MVDIKRAFDIDDFRAMMSRKGIARNNLYKLVINFPRGLKSAAGALNMPNSSEDLEDITLFCDSVTLPGLSLATITSNPYGYGPVELKAYAPIFQPMSASFIVDAKGYNLSFFKNWMRGIVNYTSEGKAVHSATVNRLAAFESAYKSEYETTMELYVLSGQALSSSDTNLNVELVSRTVITRAFPIEIGSVQMSYGYNDQYLTLPVSFSYFDWYSDNLNQSVDVTSSRADAGATGGDANVPKSYAAAINRR